MPSCPGVLPVIAHAHAGTVIGGVMLARSPYMPLAKIFRRFGTSSARSSNRSLGAPQSRPMIATLGPCCMLRSSRVSERCVRQGRPFEPHADALTRGGASAVRVSYQPPETRPTPWRTRAREASATVAEDPGGGLVRVEH